VVLVVDDEVFNQAVLKQLLGLSGLAVQIATNGSEALILLKNESYAFILSIMICRGMSGPDLILAIREMEKDQKQARTVILGHTAFGEQERHQMLHNGADGILGKPTSMTEIEDIVQHYASRLN